MTGSNAYGSWQVVSRHLVELANISQRDLLRTAFDDLLDGLIQEIGDDTLGGTDYLLRVALHPISYDPDAETDSNPPTS